MNYVKLNDSVSIANWNKPGHGIGVPLRETLLCLVLVFVRIVVVMQALCGIAHRCRSIQ